MPALGPVPFLLSAMLLAAVTPAIAVAQTASQNESKPASAESETLSFESWQTEFVQQVKPILETHCFDCHGPDTQESGLGLHTLAMLRRGGDSGEPAIAPGNSPQSHLIQLVRSEDSSERMPPDGEPLSLAQIDIITKWIDQGPDWKLQPQPKLDSVDQPDHWAFQPIPPPSIPKVSAFQPSQQTSLGPIDRFVHQRLSENNLTPSPTASRRTLIRRLYLDLLGLPPTKKQIQNFEQDPSPLAYENLVESLLADPAYGERWGRYWLDLVRFAETDGFETNRERPNAWPFRDYVVRALNDDMPYDQFLLEQLAGDQSGNPVATAYLVAGTRDIVKSPDIVLTKTQRQNELDDMINTTGTAMLGLTLGCARCHNHKFDPISQTDYYAVQAVFTGVQHGDRKLPPTPEPLRKAIPSADIQPPSRRPPVSPQLNTESFAPVKAKHIRFTITQTNGGEPCIDELEIYSDQTNVALASSGAIATASGTLPGYKIHQLHHINDGKVGNDHSWISNTPHSGWVQISLSHAHSIDRLVWARDRNGNFSDRLAIEYKIETSSDGSTWSKIASSDNRLAFDQANSADQSNLVYAGIFQQPDATHRLFRGDPMAPREQIAPNTVALLGDLQLTADASDAERRLALARWITSTDNRLTPRVIVNRLWQHHFGQGLVATPSDFGKAGVPPTHPQLLDYLAHRLLENAWSLKSIQREILLSATYRQSNAPNPQALEMDAGNQWLWRFNPRRLEAEAIRDSILAVTGVLDHRMGGPGFSAFEIELENVRHYHPKSSFGPEDWRRMIYMTKVRQEQDAVFGIFDCPDGSTSVPARGRSTTPLQALNLFNSQFVLQQSKLFSSMLVTQHPGDPDRQITSAYWRCFGRPPQNNESQLALKFIAEHGLESFCRAMLNSNEFLFLQ